MFLTLNNINGDLTECSDVVASRRGRWVIKLALALFLSRQDGLTVGDLGAIHSEMWRHDALARESLARGYAPSDAAANDAESAWKQRLGRMWMNGSFEACIEDLEPYFVREFARIRRPQQQQQQKELEHKPEPGLDAEPKDDDCELIADGSDTHFSSFGRNIDAGLGKDITVGQYLERALFTNRFDKQLSKLFRCVVSYVRSVGVVTEDLDEGWVPVVDVLAHLRGASCALISKGDVEMTPGEVPVWMPTTPAQLVAVLRKVDLLRRLQFRCDGDDDGDKDDDDYNVFVAKDIPLMVSLQTPASTNKAKNKVFFVRAAWAHALEEIGTKVMDSHPILRLRVVLLQPALSVKYYDFVENVLHLQKHLSDFGGRLFRSYRPFILLVPDTLLRQDDNSNLVAWASMLAVNKVKKNSAFICISQAFITMHMESFVRVVHPQVGSVATGAANNVYAGAVFLLPVSAICSSAIAKITDGGIFVRPDVLYGDYEVNDLAVDALRPRPIETSEEGNSSSQNNLQELDGIKATGTLCRLVQERIHFKYTVVSENVVTRDPSVDSKTQVVSRDLPFFDFAAAQRCLHFVAREAALAAVDLGVADMSILSTRWLVTSSTLLNTGKATELWPAVLALSEFSDPSIILPRGLRDEGVVLHGSMNAIKRLRAENKAGAFSPIAVSRERTKKCFILYIDDAVSSAVLTTTPFLLLRPLCKVREEVNGFGEKHVLEQKNACENRAALIVARKKGGTNASSCDGEIYIAVEMTEEMEVECRYRCISIDGRDDGDGVDDHKDEYGGSESEGTRDLPCLRRTVVFVDEWELTALSSITDIIEHEFVVPFKHFVYEFQLPSNFTDLLSEMRISLLDNLRQQLLLALTPEMNESLEYLGDAVVDFVFAQKTLDTWKHGPIVAGTTNASLATYLPEKICRYMQLHHNIVSQKRKADVVEAIFGALVMAFWVIPKKKAEKDPASVAEIPRFEFVLYAVQKLMDIMKIAF